MKTKNYFFVEGILDKDAGIVKEICKNVDSFRFVVTNPDSKKIRFVPYEMNSDSFRIVDHES
jgi:hypothetical protein